MPDPEKQKFLSSFKKEFQKEVEDEFEKNGLISMPEEKAAAFPKKAKEVVSGVEVRQSKKKVKKKSFSPEEKIIRLGEINAFIEEQKSKNLNEINKYKSGGKSLSPLENLLLNLKMVMNFLNEKEIDMFKKFSPSAISEISQYLGDANREILQRYKKVVKEKGEEIKKRNGANQEKEGAEEIKKESEKEVAISDEKSLAKAKRKIDDLLRGRAGDKKGGNPPQGILDWIEDERHSEAILNGNLDSLELKISAEDRNINYNPGVKEELKKYIEGANQKIEGAFKDKKDKLKKIEENKSKKTKKENEGADQPSVVSPETDESEKKEQKGYGVVDRRKLTASEKEDLEEKLMNQEETIKSSAKIDKKGWETVSSRSGGKMAILAGINQMEIDRLNWEKASGKSKAEMPKVKDGAPEETESIIEKLEKDVEAKRNKYAMAEYKATNVVSRIRKIIPFVKTNSGDVAEVSKMHDEYKNSLSTLLNEKLKNLKTQNLSEEDLKKEMGDLVNYFKVDEKRKLFETYTNSRAKYIEENVGDKPGKIMEFSSRFINWHRKQAGWKKTVVGLGFGSIGLGFITRTVGAVSAGVGVKEMLEGRYRKKEAKIENEEKEQVLKEMEPDEQNFEKLYNFLEKDISSTAEKLKKEKRESLKRTLTGLGVGFVIGSGALSGLTQKGLGYIKMGLGYIGEYTGLSVDNLDETKSKISEILSKKPSGSKLGGVQPEVAQTESTPTIKNPLGVENGADTAPIKPSTAPLTEIDQPGKPSLESETFLKPDDIPKTPLPDNMSGDDYATQEEPRSFAPPSEDLRGENVPTDFSEQDIIGTPPEATETKNFIPDSQNPPTPPETLPVSETIPEAGHHLEIKSGSSLWETLEENGLNKREISSMLSKYAEENSLDPKDLNTVYPGQEIQLSPDGKSIERILESLDSHLMKSITEISGGNNSVWREIKNLGFDQIEKPSLTQGLAKVMEKYQEILGDNANPNSGEKIQNWVARMAKLAMEKQISN